jgi:hypothetical protein
MLVDKARRTEEGVAIEAAPAEARLDLESDQERVGTR